jgi:two-component system chemotaxis response regulator CheY
MDANQKTVAAPKVLIADDSAAVREAIRLTVQDVAGEIIEASDGGEAVNAYAAHRPAWVTLDLAMEPVDGFTAMRQIKTQDPAARIIVVTGYDIESFREAAKSRGASNYVLKEHLWKIRELIAPAASSTANQSEASGAGDREMQGGGPTISQSQQSPKQTTS